MHCPADTSQGFKDRTTDLKTDCCSFLFCSTVVYEDLHYDRVPFDRSLYGLFKSLSELKKIAAKKSDELF